MALSDLLRGLILSWYNKNVTRLTTQGCNNIVISWLYRIRWNNLATSLIISTSLLQVVNCLLQTCWQLGTSSANTTCWRLIVGRLATRCEIFTCFSAFRAKALRLERDKINPFRFYEHIYAWTFRIFARFCICWISRHGNCEKVDRWLQGIQIFNLEHALSIK
jgi:hypothetical protein